MQRDQVVGVVTLQHLVQKLAEQVVIAVPAAFVVERNQKQVGAFEVFEHPLAVGALRERITQRGVNTLRQRRLYQKSTHIGGLAVEDFLGHIIEDVTVRAG